MKSLCSLSLRDSGSDGYCNMVLGDPTSSEDEEAKAMPQDSGDTEAGRKEEDGGHLCW